MRWLQSVAIQSTFARPSWRTVFMPPLVLVLLSWPLQQAGGDLWIADHLYRWQGGAWAARDAWWSSSLLHTHVRHLAIMLWLAIAGAWLGRRLGRFGATRTAPLGYMAIALLICQIALAVLKQLSGVDCPWDLTRYGGTRPYAPLLSEAWLQPGAGACFPAAHAGVGYAWMAAAFALAQLRPAWTWPALASAIAVGALLGWVQQMRGAHFLSHDLCTLAVCWLVASGLARFWHWPNADENAPTPAISNTVTRA